MLGRRWPNWLPGKSQGFADIAVAGGRRALPPDDSALYLGAALAWCPGSTSALAGGRDDDSIARPARGRGATDDRPTGSLGDGGAEGERAVLLPDRSRGFLDVGLLRPRDLEGNRLQNLL